MKEHYNISEAGGKIKNTDGLCNKALIVMSMDLLEQKEFESKDSFIFILTHIRLTQKKKKNIIIMGKYLHHLYIYFVFWSYHNFNTKPSKNVKAHVNNFNVRARIILIFEEVKTFENRYFFRVLFTSVFWQKH